MKYSHIAKNSKVDKHTGLEDWEKEVFQAFGTLFRRSAFENVNAPQFFGLSTVAPLNQGLART